MVLQTTALPWHACPCTVPVTCCCEQKPAMLHLPAALTALLSRLVATVMALVTGSCSPESVTGALCVTVNPVVDVAEVRVTSTDKLVDGVAS